MPLFCALLTIARAPTQAKSQTFVNMGPSRLACLSTYVAAAQPRLSGLFRKLDPQYQIVVTESIHPSARLGRVPSISEADEGEPLRPSRLPVLRQEHPRHAAPPLKHVPQLLLLRIFRHICNPQRRQIIPLILTPHLLPLPTAPLPGGHVLPARHLPTPSRPSTRSNLGHRIGRGLHPRPRLPFRRHRPLKRAPRREMLPITDPALHRRVLQLLLLPLQLRHRAPLRRILALLPLEPLPRLQLYVLAHARRVALRAGGVARGGPELGPGAPRGDRGVDAVRDDGLLDDARGLYLFGVGVAQPVGGVGLGAVGVLGDGRAGEDGGGVRGGGVFVVGPGGAFAVDGCEFCVRGCVGSLAFLGGGRIWGARELTLRFLWWFVPF